VRTIKSAAVLVEEAGPRLQSGLINGWIHLLLRRRVYSQRGVLSILDADRDRSDVFFCGFMVALLGLFGYNIFCRGGGSGARGHNRARALVTRQDRE
jgi:hypothetical protein